MDDDPPSCCCGAAPMLLSQRVVVRDAADPTMAAEASTRAKNQELWLSGSCGAACKTEGHQAVVVVGVLLLSQRPLLTGIRVDERRKRLLPSKPRANFIVSFYKGIVAVIPKSPQR